MFGRALPEKKKFFSIFEEHSKVKDGSFSNADSSQYHQTNGKQKIKHLKTRKERSQRKGKWKETSKTTSNYHHRHSHRSGKDMPHFHTCGHSDCHSRRHASFPSVVPAAQEPSIITGSRLIGHHGLFNNDMKSIDIERLLNEQRKLEHSVEEVTEKENDALHLSSTSHIPAPADVAKNKEDPAGKEEQKNLHFNSQGTDITPGQRPQQKPDDLSFESTVSSKHSSLSGIATQTRKDIAERNSMKTANNKIKRHTTPKQTSKNQPFSVQDTQTDSLITSPLQLSSSPTADSCNTQHRRDNPEYVSKSARAVASRLCDCLQFPFLKRRNLVSESRKVLLKSLRERHGAWLQTNLSKVQQYLNQRVYSTEKDGGAEPTMEDQFLQPTGNWHFNWKDSSQPQQIQEQVKKAEWPTITKDTCVLDDFLRPDVSPQHCMDFNPSGSSLGSLFAPSTTFRKVEKPSTSNHWEHRFNRSIIQESPKFDFFENSPTNNTSTAHSTGTYYKPQYQPLFPNRTQLPLGRSAEATDFKQEQDPFRPDTYTSAPSFPIHHTYSFQPFSQFGHPAAQPALMSHNTDMMHYPPSHMLESETVPSFSSFTSPDDWSFPPMRLY
ncbi:proline-rich protein 19 [Parambassis ranga]|uniref:Proline-rich protein 19 n=1 Tax=Parambassis ranga TaxID=210632 RepID=A0A6P7JY31_9TELE|nr:uncharacterized protein LOC114448874 [Parambassis ranga]